MFLMRGLPLPPTLTKVLLNYRLSVTWTFLTSKSKDSNFAQSNKAETSCNPRLFKYPVKPLANTRVGPAKEPTGLPTATLQSRLDLEFRICSRSKRSQSHLGATPSFCGLNRVYFFFFSSYFRYPICIFNQAELLDFLGPPMASHQSQQCSKCSVCP
jgi:hypothetical protein